MPPLRKSDIKQRLDSMSGWKLDDDEIQKRFEFPDFRQAIAFVNRIADAAEEMDHHPDMEISYNKVKIELSTHSEGGVTAKDFELAAKIDAVAGPESGMAASQ